MNDSYVNFLWPFFSFFQGGDDESHKKRKFLLIFNFNNTNLNFSL